MPENLAATVCNRRAFPAAVAEFGPWIRGLFMPRATTCVFEGREIGIDEALQLRDDEGSSVALDFRCGECDKRVRPHRAGGATSAHFEHLSRNSGCSRSDA